MQKISVFYLVKAVKRAIISNIVLNINSHELPINYIEGVRGEGFEGFEEFEGLRGLNKE